MPRAGRDTTAVHDAVTESEAHLARESRCASHFERPEYVNGGQAQVRWLACSRGLRSHNPDRHGWGQVNLVAIVIGRAEPAASLIFPRCRRVRRRPAAVPVPAPAPSSCTLGGECPYCGNGRVGRVDSDATRP
jgi:hypothetical protein